MDFYVQLLPQCAPRQQQQRQQQRQQQGEQEQQELLSALKVCAAAGQARAEVTSLRSEKGRVETSLAQADARVHSLQQVRRAARLGAQGARCWAPLTAPSERRRYGSWKPGWRPAATPCSHTAGGAPAAWHRPRWRPPAPGADAPAGSGRSAAELSIPSPTEAGELPLREEIGYLQGQLLELQHLSQDQDAELDRLRSACWAGTQRGQGLAPARLTGRAGAGLRPQPRQTS